MAPFLTASLLIISLPLLMSADHNIIAEPGDTPILPCRVPDSRPVIVVDWDRADLGSDYVLLFRDDQFDPEGQHPSFKDRVDLLDRQMTDGDVSLVLKHATSNDSGMYECRVDFSQSIHGRKPNFLTDALSTIYLQVVSSGQAKGQEEHGGHSGLFIGLGVFAVILVTIIALIVIVRRRLPRCHPPPHNEAESGPL